MMYGKTNSDAPAFVVQREAEREGGEEGGREGEREGGKD